MDADKLFETFSTINTIIEHDATDTTYKYSLLQSVIEICQGDPKYIKVDNTTHQVHIPLGLCVFKWIIYYYPFFLPGKYISLKQGEKPDSKKHVAFRKYFEKVCLYYKDHGGISVLVDVLINKSGKDNIQPEIFPTLLKLIGGIAKVISDGPIPKFGNSQNSGDYSIFKLENESDETWKPKKLSLDVMISDLGIISFSEDLYYIFRELGGYIIGSGTIYQRFRDFLLRNNNESEISEAELLQRMAMVPQTERDVETAKNFYQNLLKSEGCTCIWSGIPLTKRTLVVDHMLPFSIWKSNDLWNLIPANSRVNLEKSDKIPSPELLKERKESIFEIWDILHSSHKDEFEADIMIGLLSGEFGENWKEEAFQQLINNADYLINVRGYAKWDINSKNKKK